MSAMDSSGKAELSEAQHKEFSPPSVAQDDEYVQAKITNDPDSITNFKEVEHNISTFKALKIHYKAVGWALFFGMSVIGW